MNIYKSLLWRMVFYIALNVAALVWLAQQSQAFNAIHFTLQNAVDKQMAQLEML